MGAPGSWIQALDSIATLNARGLIPHGTPSGVCHVRLVVRGRRATAGQSVNGTCGLMMGEPVIIPATVYLCAECGKWVGDHCMVAIRDGEIIRRHIGCWMKSRGIKRFIPLSSVRVRWFS